MRAARRLAMAQAVAVTAVLCACSPSPAPDVQLEVNDANCMPGFLRTLPKGVREDLAGRCFRRGTFVPSPKRAW